MIDISNIPKNPGCYLFKDKNGNIIYIGKAKNLKKRVSSYLRRSQDQKTEIMVSKALSVDYIVTDSEVEALILENNLIKKHSPKYNIDLKDSKRYAYIQLTDEDFSRAVIARKRGPKGQFFGPFVSAANRDYVLDLIKKTFRLRTCKKMPRRPCLRHHIKLCDGPCIGEISKTAYLEKIQAVKLILNGKISDLVKILKEKMKRESTNQNYEGALEIRNQLDAVLYLKEKQNMELKRSYNEDIINYIVKDKTVFLMVFNIDKGTLVNKQDYVFDFKEDFFEEFLSQYYSRNRVPREIIITKKVSDALVEFLCTISKSKIKFVVPKIGEKRTLLDLIKKNIESHYFAETKSLDELRIKLKLSDTPHVIECFDVSHLSGTSTVGSMVQFRNGVPDKTNYRRFRIRTVEGIDDVKSISELVRRRYSRLIKERKEFPNLVVIDGGKGQLQAALLELNKLGISIPTISLAKQFEEIYVPGLKFPIRLDKKSKALKLLQQIRDEAHRFAIAYNRLLRKKELIK